MNGIQAGDVLLAYAGTTLKEQADVKIVAADAGPKKVPVRYWREGVTRQIEVAAGPLGVAIDNRPAKEVVLASQAAERVVLGTRGGSHQRLPGTRREVEAVARLFPAGTVTTLMGEQARESTVQDLARSGRMKAFRYLHFATHGESDPRHAYRSALILAPDPDRSADPLAFDSDGTITAEQIARTWDLDADLVVLSACESGLGRAAGGERVSRLRPAPIRQGCPQPGAEPVEGRRRRHGAAHDAVLPKPAGEAREPEAAPAQGRGAGRGQGVAPRRRARGSRSGPGRAPPRHDSSPRGRRDEARGAPYEDPTYWAGFILIGSPVSGQIKCSQWRAELAAGNSVGLIINGPTDG